MMKVALLHSTYTSYKATITPLRDFRLSQLVHSGAFGREPYMDKHARLVGWFPCVSCWQPDLGTQIGAFVPIT